MLHHITIKANIPKDTFHITNKILCTQCVSFNPKQYVHISKDIHVCKSNYNINHFEQEQAI